jgi:hypothetical protein
VRKNLTAGAKYNVIESMIIDCGKNLLEKFSHGVGLVKLEQ